MSKKYEAILSRLDKKISSLVYLLQDVFRNPIIINAYVKYSQGRVVKNNWGDDINYYFLKEVTKRSICIYNHSFLSMRLKRINYLCIGSTINLLTTQKTIVWGAGAISSNLEMPNIPMKVHAVRGPLTRTYLIQKGIYCPSIYGDPALLLPYYYTPVKRKKYKVGVIPHYVDIDNENVKRIVSDFDVHLILIREYQSWQGFVDEICSCEHIISSSLHGLIVAESYGIPNTWIEFSDNLYGGHFKFHDFFLSINRDRIKPVRINDITNINALLKSDNWQQGHIDLQPLIEACPFALHLNTYNEHSLDLRSSL